MDRLECGQCKQIFTKLELFIQHKQLGCEKDLSPTSNDDPTNSNDDNSKGPEQLDNYPLKFQDLSSYIIKKQLVKQVKKKDDPAERIRRLKQRIQEALPSGYCGTCSPCLTKSDCTECATCLAGQEEPTQPGTSKAKERCLMRVCELLSTNNEYQVEKLLDKKIEDDEPHYLVKWKGYPNSANTWEPASNIISKNLIEEFEQANKASLKRRRLDDLSELGSGDPKRMKTSLMGSLGLNEISTNSENEVNAAEEMNPGRENSLSSSKDTGEISSKNVEPGSEEITAPLEHESLLDVDVNEIRKEEEKHLLDLNEFLTFEKSKDSQDSAEKDGINQNVGSDTEKNNAGSTMDKKDKPELPRNARKSLRGAVPNLTRRQLENILKEIQYEANRAKNPNLSESDGDELKDNSSDGTRPGRSTKKAALNFIRSVCKSGVRPDSDNDEKQDKVKTVRARISDRYEKTLDLSEAYSTIYIPDPVEKEKMILVNGLQKQISLLEGANLNPTVLVQSKTPLRQPSKLINLEDLEKQEEFLKALLDDDDEFYDELIEDEQEMSEDIDIPEDTGDDEFFYTESYLKGPVTQPTPKKKVVKPEPNKLTPESNPMKRKKGRPKKEESEAKRKLLRKDEEKLPDEKLAGEVSEILGTRRKKGRPVKYSEYIDPDTVVQEDDDSKAKSDVSSLTPEDDDFEPPQITKPSGRPRGRPKHMNIFDTPKSKDSNQKFAKSHPPSKADIASRGKVKKNRVFVVMPDGTMVEVSGSDKDQAIKKATAKMENVQKRSGGKKKADQDDGKKDKNVVKTQKLDMRPSLEECTNDAVDDHNTLKLPNTVQLVESELPLSEAENAQSLVGMYLFRQIYSPNDSELFCKLCKGKVTLRYPADLEKHYHVIHEITVQIFKAEFSENVVFVCVPGDVSETTVLNSGCRFCDVTLRTLSEVRDHYPSSHSKDVRLIAENAVLELGDRFYCSVCSNASVDFATHHQHMKSQHSMQTYICKHCNFCSPKPNRIRTHFKQRHVQEQPGPHLQCSVCSVYVHGRERLNKHILLSHAVQTGAKTWSCSKCLQPCGDAKDLMSHIPTCPYVINHGLEDISDDSAPKKLLKNSEITITPIPAPAATTNNKASTTQYYKCTICSVTFSTEAEIKKHMADGIHVNSNEVSILPVILDETNQNTCFLCNMKFSGPDLLKLHFQHVHMRWVAKGAVDYTTEELEDSPQELEEELRLLKEIEKENEEGKKGTDEEQEIIRQLENELEGMTNNSKDEARPMIGPDITLPIKPLNPLKMTDLPNDYKLSEIGFPSKVGHYCHLCDTVIKSYALYYLHMHNLHGLEKRFQCIISSCSQTFKSTLAFQHHSHRHDQKSDIFCSMCDLVFGSEEELEEHVMSQEHATKYMRVQEKYNRSEPRNYRCKVCHCWYGLFATFVKHMETENHQYKCQHCGLMFVQPGPRRNHIQSVHPDLANICEICGTRLQNSQALWSHLSMHNIVYECEKCHRRFLQKEQLTAHMEIHAPPTPCPWDGCNRKLSTKVGLYNHLRMHKGDADFVCNICSKGFFKKKTLEIHMKSHEKNVTRKNYKTKVNPAGQGVETVLHIDESSQNNQELSAPSVELIQFICAGCLNGFDSEERFAAHECSGHATQEQLEAAQAAAAAGVLNQEDILNQAAESAQVEQTHVITDEDLAAQLAQAVAEATTQGQMSFSSSHNVTMSDGTVVTMTTMDSDGTVLPSSLQNLVEGKGGTVLASTDSSGNITFIRTAEDDPPVSQLEQLVNEAQTEGQFVEEAEEGEKVQEEQYNEQPEFHQQPQDHFVQHTPETFHQQEEHFVETGEGQEEGHYEEQGGEEYEQVTAEQFGEGNENHFVQEGEGEFIQQEQTEEPMDGEQENSPMEFEGNEGEDNSQQALYLTEEEALLAAQSGQLKQNSDGTFVMHTTTGEEQEGQEDESIVMMVAGDEEGNEHHVMDGNQPYSILKVPTEDGGEQVLLIPLNSDGENTVLTLPSNVMLSEGEGADGTAVTFQEHSTNEDGEQVQQTYLTLPEGTNVQELLQGQQTVLSSQLENELINAVNQ